MTCMILAPDNPPLVDAGSQKAKEWGHSDVKGVARVRSAT